MRREAVGGLLVAGILAIAGCGKKSASVALVPAPERSPSFEAVNRHLELGGTLYLYADVDGDADKLATDLHLISENAAASQPMAAAFLKQDYKKLFAILGLNDVKAFGLSSVPAGGGEFRDNVFFYTPQGRHGLLASLGGPPGPFLEAKLAPPDADFFSESEVDLPAVYTTLKGVVAQVAGDSVANMIDAKLGGTRQQLGFSVLDLINGFKGRTVTVLRFDPKKNFTLPGPKPVTIPAFSLLVRIDGIGATLEGALAKLPLLAPSQEGSLKLYTLKIPLPVPDLQPVVAIEGTTFYLATSREFLLECQQRTAGLDQAPEFKRALASVGSEGNGLTYCSPRLFARLRELASLNPDVPPQVRQVLQMVTNQMPVVDQPLVTVRTNLPDGILIRSHLNRSLKRDLAMVAIYNPVTVGVMAAMAIPAFQKVRQASQEKTVLNNLRMLRAAADQYYLEHGVDTATYDDLVGPDKYIKSIHPVAGENYRALKFHSGQPLRIRMANGHLVELPQ